MTDLWTTSATTSSMTPVGGETPFIALNKKHDDFETVFLSNGCMTNTATYRNARYTFKYKSDKV